MKNINGKNYWRSLEQLDNSTEYVNFVKNEFPDGTFDLPNGISRKKFLSLMGASLAMAGLVGCRRPVEKIIPHVIEPENIIPGVPKHYSTSFSIAGDVYGAVVENHEGRPTKIEGNPSHPLTKGKSNSWLQGTILDLYDPDRLKNITNSKKEAKLSDFLTIWNTLTKKYASTNGEGFAVLTETTNSPTFERLKNLFIDNFPKVDWVTWEPISDENILNGIKDISGSSVIPKYTIGKAKVIVSLDSDFLNTETNSISNTFDFSNARRVKSEKNEMNRLYVIENSLSLTGGMADHRYRLTSSQMGELTLTLISELKELGLNISAKKPSSNVIDKTWVKELAKDLFKNKGKSLVMAGRGLSSDIHALVFAINNTLSNLGNTVEYFTTDNSSLSDTAKFGKFSKKLNSGKISTLIMFGGNPVYNAPSNFNFANGLKRVNNTIHLSTQENETSTLSDWVINKSHALESWGDTKTAFGDFAITQPQIEPLFNGISSIEFLARLTGDMTTGYELVRTTWSSILDKNFNQKWDRVLHDGIFTKNLKSVKSRVKTNLTKFIPKSNSKLEIVFKTSPSLFDGRFANNGWLQETSDPITKLAWDNVALMSHSTAQSLNVKNNDMIAIKNENGKIEIPVWVMPGHADNSISIELGYGRTVCGRIGDNVGQNAYLLRDSNSMWLTSDVMITKLNKTMLLACTQDHHGLDTEKLAADAIQERLPMIYRESTFEEYQNNPKFVEEYDSKIPLKSMWDEHEYKDSPQWGMSIDLNVCTGCNACSVSCQSENNIPIIGKEQVEKGREMSWMRMDRYYTGDMDNPEVAIQPVNCQHCEMAPCEQVCPVAATTHTEDGLNGMTYNRCVGTRYCANNCPYKVRRFNFYNYTKDLPEIVQMAQNPDVTVRFRGVMEKCTFCVQKINQAKIKVNNENRELVDGDVVSACQQSCPADAIVFGDLTDPNSKISLAKKENRDYALLGELNLKPRVTYLAKLRNPNPALINHKFIN
jgi:MoCo/4Fe-4S cofactor protein with predicted Tat translocation signal